MRLGQYGLAGGPDMFAVFRSDLALEADQIGAFGARKLPGMRLAQPVLRGLDLTAPLEQLAEQAVLIADPVAIGRAADRRHRFHETGRQPPQAAIPKRGIRFIADQCPQIHADRRHRSIGLVVKAEIDDRILQQAPDQKLHRQVADPLMPRRPGLAGRGEPRPDDPVAHRIRQRHTPVIDAGIRRVLPKREGQMAQDVIGQIAGKQAVGQTLGGGKASAGGAGVGHLGIPVSLYCRSHLISAGAMRNAASAPGAISPPDRPGNLPHKRHI